jgi:hypothetical protein
MDMHGTHRFIVPGIGDVLVLEQLSPFGMGNAGSGHADGQKQVPTKKRKEFHDGMNRLNWPNLESIAVTQNHMRREFEQAAREKKPA